MRDLGMEQFRVLGKVDPGFPDWRGDVIKHYSTGELNLAKMDFEQGKITRPEFLLRVINEFNLKALVARANANKKLSHAGPEIRDPCARGPSQQVLRPRGSVPADSPGRDGGRDVGGLELHVGRQLLFHCGSVLWGHWKRTIK